MAETPTVCEHLHLPLQAGSDRVLAAMHRGYTAERYLERLAAARAAIPDLAVTTDIIVGFPGETDDDFERTLEVAAEAAYDSAYTFVYSPRPGTEAAGARRRVRARRGVRRAVRAAARGGRAVGAGPPRGAGRPHRGGPRRGPEQEGRRRHHRPHPPEQARPLRGRPPLRAGTFADVAGHGCGRPPPHRRLSRVTAAARHRTRIPVAAGSTRPRGDAGPSIRGSRAGAGRPPATVSSTSTGPGWATSPPCGATGADAAPVLSGRRRRHAVGVHPHCLTQGADLRRDGRYALHTCSPVDVDDEFYVTGRAAEVDDDGCRRAPMAATTAQRRRRHGDALRTRHRAGAAGHLHPPGPVAAGVRQVGGP